MAILAVCSPMCLAQGTGQSSTTLHVESQLVVLDTTVTGREGKLVRGLHKEDFTIYENGIPQTIKDFSSAEEGPAIPESPRKDRNGHDDWGAAPLAMIVMDELDTPFSELGYVRDCVWKFIRTQPAELKTPTVLLWLNEHGIHELTPFTRDREMLLTALGRQPAGHPSRLMRGDVAGQLAASLAALQQVALFSRGNSGNKEIIWVGRSFPSVDPVGLHDYERTVLRRAVRSTVDLLLASRATVYVVDPTVTGSARDDDTAQEVDTLKLSTASSVLDPFASSFNVNLFVAMTGGKYFRGTNDLDQQIVAIQNRANSHYTLTYVPTTPIHGISYRRIDVKMRDPSLRAHTKRGYYGEDAAPDTPSTKLETKLDAGDLRFDLYEAAITGMLYTGVGVHVDTCTQDAASSLVSCSASVDTSSLTFSAQESGEERATLVTVVASVDAKGKLLNDTINRLTIAIPREQVKGIATGFSRLHLQTMVPPHTAAIRIVIREASGRIGTADVPPELLPQLTAADSTKSKASGH